MSRFIIETNNELIDVSGCSIKIRSLGPVMEYDHPDVSYNLYAIDFRTGEEVALAKSTDKKPIESAYEKIKSALKNNESYVDITNCEPGEKESEIKGNSVVSAVKGGRGKF